MIRKFAGHDSDSPPGTVSYHEVKTIGDYVRQAQEAEGWSMEPLTKTGQVCYIITTGMSLRDLKDGIGQAYWNRDRETLDRLLESLVDAE